MISETCLIESVNSEIFRWPGYSAFKKIFLDNGKTPTYVSGGIIRNIAMGTSSHTKDYDFFIDIEDYKEKIEALKDHGELYQTPYGAPRWYPKNCNVYADLMPIQTFTPGLWSCLDITDILNQFDFTMNAIALDLNTNKIFNPVNGLRDAFNKTLKMVRFDYPSGPFLRNQKIDRNAIIWIRAVHYASKYGLNIEPITLAWMQKNIKFKNSIPAFSETFFKPEEGILLQGLI